LERVSQSSFTNASSSSCSILGRGRSALESQILNILAKSNNGGPENPTKIENIEMGLSRNNQ